MGVEEKFGDLGLGLKRLQDAFEAMRMTIGDKPVGDDSMVVDQIDSEASELLSLIQEAREVGEEGVKGLRSAPDLDATRRALKLCQEWVQTIERRYADMVAFDEIQRLLGLRERGREWAAWANAARRDMEDCRSPMREVSEALAACWQELTELFVWLAKTSKKD
jgi:hypothetical protein